MRTSFLAFWAIARPYWSSPERVLSGLLLAAVIALNLGIVYVMVLINDWNALFYNALQNYDLPDFWWQLVRFCVLATIYIIAAVYRVYLRQMLQIRWRNWLTQRYVGRWFRNDAYYHLQLGDNRAADNPDQRIAEDINTFVGQTLILGLGILEAVVTLASFSLILWDLSGPLTVGGLTIPGYMLWAAILYAIIGSWLTHVIGRPLISLNYQQQQFEANLRFGLVRVRENAEQIALYRGEEAEKGGIGSAFSNVVTNWWGIMKRQKLLTWFSSGYEQIAIIFPFVVAAPRYFSKSIQLGGLMQIAQAFGQVQTALSWFVTNYTSFAEWQATLNRLSGFEKALAEDGERTRALSAVKSQAAKSISISDLNIYLPDGRPLLKDLSLTFPPSSRVLISGPSGSGKSTFLRALCGIWPYCEGRILIPEGQKLLFCPQKPYLPLGTLRQAVQYPESGGVYSDADMRHALRLCGLEGLRWRLDQSENWAMKLSPGEQQRLAFARALLMRPQWLFFDEATSALDEDSEQRLYGLVADMPGCALISVAHRKTLSAFHDRTLAFTKTGSIQSQDQALAGVSSLTAMAPTPAAE
jgi:putative ATP-binding cassette transporter